MKKQILSLLAFAAFLLPTTGFCMDDQENLKGKVSKYKQVNTVVKMDSASFPTPGQVYIQLFCNLGDKKQTISGFYQFTTPYSHTYPLFDPNPTFATISGTVVFLPRAVEDLQLFAQVSDMTKSEFFWPHKEYEFRPIMNSKTRQMDFANGMDYVSRSIKNSDIAEDATLTFEITTCKSKNNKLFDLDYVVYF